MTKYAVECYNWHTHKKFIYHKLFNSYEEAKNSRFMIEMATDCWDQTIREIEVEE